MNAKLVASTIAALLALAASNASAQFDISWYTIDGGGAMMTTGGSFELSGTIGQHDAGPASGPMTGGTFELVGGFWPGASAVTCTCPGDLSGDHQKTGTDVQKFVDCFLGGATDCGCADLDGSGTLDMNDVTLFANALLTGPACP
jgi:hypothetical protein